MQPVNVDLSGIYYIYTYMYMINIYRQEYLFMLNLHNMINR